MFCVLFYFVLQPQYLLCCGLNIKGSNDQLYYIMFEMNTLDHDTKFSEEADTFNLTVSLSGDRLAVTLRDFVDWTIYSKEYTDDDVGGEIHKKMDLSDLLAAFSQSQTHFNEGSMEEQKGEVEKLKNYELGALVQNEGSPCYRIEKGGKVTAYFGVLDKKTKKEIVYESKLLLPKLRDMTEIQIISSRSEIENKKLTQKVEKQIRKISSLEQQNARIKQQLRAVKQEQNQKNQRFEQKISQITNAYQQFEERLTERNQSFYQKLAQQFSDQSERSLEKFKEMQKILQAMRANFVYGVLPQAYSHYFKVEGLKVQFVNSGNWTQYIFNNPIYLNQSLVFKLKITQAKHGYMVVGVVDYARQKDQRYSYASGNGNYLCYRADSGFKFPQGVQEGEGFKQGDILEVEVNRTTNTVTYSVNAKLQATQTNEMLKDAGRVFMPFFEVYHQNDAVEWLTE